MPGLGDVELSLIQSYRRFYFMRNIFKEFFFRLFRFFQILFHLFALGNIPQDPFNGGNHPGVIADGNIMDFRPFFNNSVFIKTENPVSRLCDRAGEDPDDFLIFFHRIDIVKKAFRHLVQLFVRNADQISDGRTHIFKLLTFVVVQKHGIRGIFHKQAKPGGLADIHKAELFKINDNEGQDQDVDRKQTDKIGRYREGGILEGESEVVDENAPYNDKKACHPLFRQILGPGI